MKLKRIFISIVSLALAILTVVCMASCTAPSNDVNDANKDTAPKTIDVPIFAADVPFGKKITSDKVTTKTISADAVSSTMLTKVEDVVGKYATVDLFKDDFAYKGKLSSKKPTNALDISEIEKTRNKFIDVSQFIQPNSGLDVYAAIQKIIDNNTHRTIYFPDGEYLISQPLKTSAAGASSTSFYLSDHAVIKASNDWKGNDAVITLGAAEPKNDITVAGSNYYFIGGILDGNGKAKGISLDSGRESLVSKVKIINATVGIYVPDGVNNKSSDMDIEDIDIIGCGGESKGIVAVGLDNNFVDIRISNVKIGVDNSGGNFFRGVSVKLDPDQLKNTSYEGTIGIKTGGSCWFYSCSVENMQTGFSFSGYSSPVIKDFSIRWTEARGSQIAFASNNSFGARCSNGIIDFFDASTQNSILKTDGSKRGLFLDVIVDESLCDDDNHKSIFVRSEVGE